MLPEIAGFAELSEIGRGGCSVVYRGHETDTGRWVALKVIDAAGASPHALESFRREAFALGALGGHPHIVTLYRTATLSDHRPFLVLELCTSSISRRIEERGVISARRATAVAVKIAGALETAHRAGLLHLDVKPGNILITQYDEPALADFGVARLHAGGRGPAGVVGLTTAHAAPEMLDGERATPAADVYQLASTVYHMVTGRPAFRAFEGEAAASLAHRVLHEPIEPIASLGVPHELADLVAWAMAKDPGARPASAAAFADALRAVELACGWVPTVPAIPGGHLPLLTQSAQSVLDAAPEEADAWGTRARTSHRPFPYGHLVRGPTPLPVSQIATAALSASPTPIQVLRSPGAADVERAGASSAERGEHHASDSPGSSGPGRSEAPVGEATASHATAARLSAAGDPAAPRRQPRTTRGLDAIAPVQERSRRLRRKRHPKEP